MNKNIMHIASFSGNIGDIINHYGFYKSFNIDEKCVEKIEIRRFYRNCVGSDKLAFNEALIEKINSKKLLILGGGGFFDVYWNESSTGTTLDMSRTFLDKIRVPVLVNAMGVHFIHKRSEAQYKFFHFLNDIRRRENWFVSIRNDGSYKRIRNIYGEDILEHIYVVPDNGFRFAVDTEPEYKKSYKKRIGLSVTNELLDPIYTGSENIDKFNDKMAKIISEYLEKAELCFFLHTPQDLLTLYEIVSRMGAEKMRKDVTIAPYSFYDNGKRILKYYKGCDAVVGMRFHSNVMAIANRIPIIGLAMHEQIEDLYREINYCKQCVKVGNPEYINILRDKIEQTLYCNNVVNEEEELMRSIEKKHNDYVYIAKKFLSCNGVIL